MYRREGHYHLEGSPPYIAGYEAAGEVIALGPEAGDIRIGDRVGFADVRASSPVRLSPCGELSFERRDLQHGVFTHALLKALTDKTADRNGDGTLTTYELPTVDRDNPYAGITLPMLK